MKELRIVHDVDCDSKSVQTELEKIKEQHPAIMLVGVRAYNAILAGTKVSETPGSETVGELLGMRVIKSPVLPAGFAIFEDTEGRVIGILRIKED